MTSNIRGGDRNFAGWQALDDDDATYWAIDDNALPARLEFDTEGSIDINAIELAEAQRTSKIACRRTRVEGIVEQRVEAAGRRQTHRQCEAAHRFPR